MFFFLFFCTLSRAEYSFKKWAFAHFFMGNIPSNEGKHSCIMFAYKVFSVVEEAFSLRKNLQCSENFSSAVGGLLLRKCLPILRVAGVLLSLIHPVAHAKVGAVTLECDRDVRVSISIVRIYGQVDQEMSGDTGSAHRGDIVEYRASYVNAGRQAIRNVSAVLKVPAGSAYLPNSALPKSIAVRVGIVMAPPFSAVSLRPVIQVLSTTSSKTRASQFRYLRWHFRAIKAGQIINVSARMRVAPSGKRASGSLKEAKRLFFCPTLD